METRLRTSKKTEEVFAAVGQREHLRPFALSKIAIAMSLRAGYHFEEKELADDDGLELHRSTITGENDALFKAMVEVNEKRNIPDIQYFPKCLKGYIDNGAILLEQEYRYGKDFYMHLLNLEEGI